MFYKTQYLYDYGIPLIEGEELETYFSSYTVSKKLAITFGSYLELNYDFKGVLKSGRIIFEGKDDTDQTAQELKLEEAIGKLKYKDYKLNKLYSARVSNTGKSFLGGSPLNFKIPDYSKFHQFLYIGCLSKNDSQFSFLEDDLHITYPIFCNSDELILDYSNPLSPKIYNENQFFTEDVYDDLPKNYTIEYQKKYISFSDVELTNEVHNHPVAHAGIYFGDVAFCELHPFSPISKKRMQFLCAIKGGSQFNVNKTSIELQYDMDELSFGNGDHLQIWWDNDNKLMFLTVKYS